MTGHSKHDLWRKLTESGPSWEAASGCGEVSDCCSPPGIPDRSTRWDTGCSGHRLRPREGPRVQQRPSGARTTTQPPCWAPARPSLSRFRFSCGSRVPITANSLFSDTSYLYNSAVVLSRPLIAVNVAYFGPELERSDRWFSVCGNVKPATHVPYAYIPNVHAAR